MGTKHSDRDDVSGKGHSMCCLSAGEHSLLLQTNSVCRPAVSASQLAAVYSILMWYSKLSFCADQQQLPPISSQLPPHHRHRPNRLSSKKESNALDMDALTDASAAASLLTVLLEHDLPDSQKSQLTPVVRSAVSPLQKSFLHAVASQQGWLHATLTMALCS